MITRLCCQNIGTTVLRSTAIEESIEYSLLEKRRVFETVVANERDTRGAYGYSGPLSSITGERNW